MYTSKIKEKHRKGIFTENIDRTVLFDMLPSKVALYDKESGLIYDLYKNKLEDPQDILMLRDCEYHVFVEAKREQFVYEYNLKGEYQIIGVKGDSLRLCSVDDPSDKKDIFPSRVKVTRLQSSRFN